MRFLATMAAGLAVGMCATSVVRADGPVREGLRRTGEVAAEGTRRVVQGTADVARGVGSATVGALQATGQAAGNLAGVDNSRNARWRFVRHGGQWWYYTPDNSWMVHRNGQWSAYSQNNAQMNEPMVNNSQPMGQPQQHITGYRGVEANAPMDQGQNQAAQPQSVQANYAPAIDGAEGQYVQPSQSSTVLPSDGAYYGQAPIRDTLTGGPVHSQVIERPAAPREINNNPAPATWGEPR